MGDNEMEQPACESNAPPAPSFQAALNNSAPYARASAPAFRQQASPDRSLRHPTLTHLPCLNHHRGYLLPTTHPRWSLASQRTPFSSQPSIRLTSHNRWHSKRRLIFTTAKSPSSVLFVRFSQNLRAILALSSCSRSLAINSCRHRTSVQSFTLFKA
jgi:hypothetical protein